MTEALSDDRSIQDIEAERDQLRDSARRTLGVYGAGDEQPPPLRETLRRPGVSAYPLFALGLLIVVDQYLLSGFSILGPDIARSVGISTSAVGVVVAFDTVAAALAGLLMSAYVQNRPRRALVCIVTAFAWSVATLGMGFVVAIGGLFLMLVLDGVSTGSVYSVHEPLLMDSYPPEARVRAFSYYRGLNAAGLVAAPLLVAFLTAVLHMTWRGVFIAMGVVGVTASLIASRLRDPVFGRWDAGRLRELVRRGDVAEGRSEQDEHTQLRFFEIVRRLLLIPTARRIFAAYAVLGIMIVPFNTFFSFYLDQRWALTSTKRALFFAMVAAVAIGSLSIFGRFGERMFRSGPARLVKATSWVFFAAMVMIIIGVTMPTLPLAAVFFAATFGLIATLLPSFSVAVLSIVPPNMRPHTASLSLIYLAGAGGVAGSILLGGVETRFGISAAIGSVCVPGIVAALMLRGASRTIEADLDRLIDNVVEEEEISKIVRSGVHVPMLSCRGIDFSYGNLQVLFDVSFAVDEGEMAALLGTNGAGKSTLLKVISGLGLPSKGSVRFEGADITYLDAERRLKLGIAQVPGGRGVFGPLSVVENLRLFGYSYGRDKDEVERGVDVSLEAFPALASRRNQPAQTLSGGEQQMLSLSKALILRPRLLMIDELSLGLAPTLVGQLMDMVRRINSEGTAIVLVEQSVNIALSLVDHAYFMEKGEIRFDGRARELLERTDLVRSVFLEGAAKGVEARLGSTEGV
ncbi:MAG: MFS transporter [Actinomycetota bacterium]